jgi:competence protein ComEC
VTVLARGDQPVAVLSGDLEEGGERRLLSAGLAPRRAGVWKAGHHGSATSGSPEFLAALEPALVLVSCGVANRYGHPSHGAYVADGDTLPILRTDLDGSLRLRWSRGGEFLGFDTALGRVP